jgi:hypothetical protein
MAKEEVVVVFEMPLAGKVWPELKKIGLDPKELEANFNGYYQGRRRSDPLLQPRLIFLEWGEEQLQPIMNWKLHRMYCHPTFYPFMEHCLAEEIQHRRLQFPQQRFDNVKPEL